ncbi:MAG TPA: hypothetical protein ENJ13_08465 [Chromatiales bacterium]|nr:hypothetical protein [Chromatiales bacterium]
MALMFQRLARNFIKNGYYPTDADTMTRVLSALVAPKTGQLRIIDPCAGEGTALAEYKHHLGTDRVEAFGVEYDNERAWHAKQILDRCIHGDIQDCVLGQRQYGLLWLNPPYGDLVSDKGSTGDQCGGKGRKRLEKLFYNLTVSALQFEGEWYSSFLNTHWTESWLAGSPRTSTGSRCSKHLNSSLNRLYCSVSAAVPRKRDVICLGQKIALWPL